MKTQTDPRTTTLKYTFRSITEASKRFFHHLRGLQTPLQSTSCSALPHASLVKNPLSATTERWLRSLSQELAQFINSTRGRHRRRAALSTVKISRKSNQESIAGTNLPLVNRQPLKISLLSRIRVRPREVLNKISYNRSTSRPLPMQNR